MNHHDHGIDPEGESPPIPADPGQEGEAVSRRAFQKWLSRTTAGNLEQQDWLEAEAEVLHLDQLSGRLADARQELRRQERDQFVAQKIQEGLLPRSMPQLPGMEVCGRMLPAESVGGDFFDFIPLLVPTGNRVAVVVADASGHGMGAALLAVETRAYLRALSLTCVDADRLLELTNQRLSIDLHSSHFVTAIVLALDPGRRSFHYSSAGHVTGHVLGRDGETRTTLLSTGMPLGIDAANTFPLSPEIDLESGDLVLLVTDGIIEAASPEQTLFGMDRALEVVRRRRLDPPEQILAALFDEVRDYCHQQRDDDFTAVIIQVK